MVAVATDLDRTLLPNGKEPYDKTLPLFKKIVVEEDILLIYVTGRDFTLVKKAMKEYNLPQPAYVIASVGARIYDLTKSTPKTDQKWMEEIKKKDPRWNVKKMKHSLKRIGGLRLQEKEKQDTFKLSYYVDMTYGEEILLRVRTALKTELGHIQIVYSTDFPQKRGLLDILPRSTTKIGALKYLVKQLGLTRKELVVCGDSGNDVAMLTGPYNAVVVRNASPKIKNQVRSSMRKKGREKNLYVGKKQNDLNGNYVSGIIQGLHHFGCISRKE